MMILKILLCMMLLLILPLLIGSVIFDVLLLKKTIIKCIVFGAVTMWALCQVVSIPLILFKQSFLLVVIILSSVYLLIVMIGLKKKSFKYIILNITSINNKIKENKLMCLWGIGLLCISVAIVLYFSLFLQHTDADDSRFGVNIVDIIKTHKMFLTNPATGEVLATWNGEVARDVISPWAVFIAYCSCLLKIHPTIMFHTIIPIFLYIYIYCVYWVLSERLVGDNILYRSIFIAFLTLLNIYGFASLQTAETFLMTRIWQGKAVVAGLGIPLLISIFVDIHEDGINKSYMVILTIVEVALCLLSGMGILIGAIMVFSYGVIYSIEKKDYKLAIKMWITVLPNVFFYGLSLFV